MKLCGGNFSLRRRLHLGELFSFGVCVAETEFMATVYTAARNLYAEVTYTRLRMT